MDFQHLRAALEPIIREAGAEALRHFEQPHIETAKSSVFDIVTEGDKAAEAVIVKALREQFPELGIVSEEGGGADAPTDAEYFVHIDPIDGTTNYAANLPYFSVSIGVADREMKPVVGLVYMPYYDELFSAAKGHGATRNGKPIQVVKSSTLETSVLVTGFPAGDIQREALSQWEALIQVTRGMRRFGSAAGDLAFVASGRFAAFYEKRIHSWDCMAGLLLVTEAGGRVSDYSGNESPTLFSGAEVVATNGLIHDELLSVLNGVS